MPETGTPARPNDGPVNLRHCVLVEAEHNPLFVPGKPIEQGSKRHVGNGRMIESNKELGPWRERVALAAHARGYQVLTGPILVVLEFVRPRPVSTPKRRTPPAVKKPDIDKLARAILDALTSICYVDDAQVTEMYVGKRIAEIGETPGVWIVVADATTRQADE